MAEQKLCALLPTHNHVAALPRLLTWFADRAIPVIVVDDGSQPDTAAEIAKVCAGFETVDLQRRASNGGKGAAVLTGLKRAQAQGFTHALQLDADGQHDLDSLPAMIKRAEQRPEALIAGEPEFNTSAPRGRRWGRRFTNLWVTINSLSRDLPDAMCGCRIYPVQATLDVVAQQNVRGRRMDFDIEVLVKIHRAGMPVLPAPVKVTYPPNNSSNFRMLRDNLLLSAMHTRLFFGMLVGLVLPPAGRRTHWANMRERGTYSGLVVLAWIYRLLGPKVCLALVSLIVGFFYLTGTTSRRAAMDYLQQAWRQGYLSRPPTHWTGFRHFLSFAESAIDKFAAWTGHIAPEDVANLKEGLLAEAEKAGGAFILTAHLGNPEALRAVAGVTGRWRVNVLVHTIHARMFNRMIARFSPESTVRMTQVSNVGPETAIELADAIERGEWVVMVGDRVPVSDNGRTITVPFMGRMAELPQGPFILAAILKCPCYVMFCTKGDDGFKVHFEPFADPVRLPRGRREEAIEGYATRFAEMMETQVARTPMQWFNFYPFWKDQP